MADVYTDIDNTLDVEANFDNAPQDINAEEQATDSIQVGAQPEQLLSLIGANERLAATNAQLVEQVLPTLRGGLQTKEVAPADIEQVITPDDGYLGLQRVKVAPYEREVQVVNRRANESEFLYYMEDIATQYQRSDYAVCMAGEFYKNADTTILAGADAYLTSDGDFYTAQTTHTWHDDDDIHANRWVVYYFKEGENKSNFMIVDATACPNVLAVKGHLGAIIANIAVPIQDIIVPDGNSVLDLRFSKAEWSHTAIVKHILNQTVILFNGNSNVVVGEAHLISTDIEIASGCNKLQQLMLPELEATYDNPIVRSCGQVRKIVLPKLKLYGTKTHGANWAMFSGCSVDVVNMPELETISIAYPFTNAIRKRIYMPMLTQFLGNTFFYTNGELSITHISMGSIVSFSTFSSGVKFTKLIHFEFGADGGAGLSTSLNLYCWTCSAIDLTADDLVDDKDKFTNNKKQLLYNFKTCTIERLQNRANMSRLTLTIGTYLYNIVTQETDDSLTGGVPYGEWLTAKLAEINWSLASA